MNRSKELTKEINDLTLKIEQDYPELYQHLGEMPNTLPSRGRPNVDDNNLADYLDSLKQLLKHHRETHKKTDQ